MSTDPPQSRLPLPLGRLEQLQACSRASEDPLLARVGAGVPHRSQGAQGEGGEGGEGLQMEAVVAEPPWQGCQWSKMLQLALIEPKTHKTALATEAKHSLSCLIPITRRSSMQH